MSAADKTILVCDCNRTMPLDGAALARALALPSPLPVHSMMCQRELAQYSQAAQGNLVVACTQEQRLLGEAAEEGGRAQEIRFVNIRETAGWSADARAEMISAATSAYSAALADPLAAGDRATAYGWMRGMREIKSVIYMALENEDGTILAQLGAGASLKGKTADLRTLGGLDLLRVKRGSISLDVKKGAVKIGRLVVLADITDLHDELWSTLRWTAMVGFIAILGGVALAQFTIARITSPIRELATAMAEVGAKQDFSRRVTPAKRRDETGVLGEAFNDMLTNKALIKIAVCDNKTMPQAEQPLRKLWTGSGRAHLIGGLNLITSCKP